MFTKEERKRYISILADGKFHESVSMGTEDSIIREYETSDGKKGSKNELVYSRITATIVNISFLEGDYGEILHLGIKGEEGEAIITVNTTSRFGSDIMKRLPNINLNESVEFAPWSMDAEGRKRTGIVLKQNGEKVESFFEAQTGDGKWIVKNGFPKANQDSTKSQWKLYFLQVTEFLANYIKENICPKINNVAQSKEVKEIETIEDIRDSIPF